MLVQLEEIDRWTVEISRVDTERGEETEKDIQTLKQRGGRRAGGGRSSRYIPPTHRVLLSFRKGHWRREVT